MTSELKNMLSTLTEITDREALQTPADQLFVYYEGGENYGPELAPINRIELKIEKQVEWVYIYFDKTAFKRPGRPVSCGYSGWALGIKSRVQKLYRKQTA